MNDNKTEYQKCPNGNHAPTWSRLGIYIIRSSGEQEQIGRAWVCTWAGWGEAAGKFLECDMAPQEIDKFKEWPSDLDTFGFLELAKKGHSSWRGTREGWLISKTQDGKYHNFVELNQIPPFQDADELNDWSFRVLCRRMRMDSNFPREVEKLLSRRESVIENKEIAVKASNGNQPESPDFGTIEEVPF